MLSLTDYHHLIFANNCDYFANHFTKQSIGDDKAVADIPITAFRLYPNDDCADHQNQPYIGVTTSFANNVLNVGFFVADKLSTAKPLFENCGLCSSVGLDNLKKLNNLDSLKNLDNIHYYSQDKLNRQDFLWQQNCFECFIELDNSQGYLEINANKHTQYAIYEFDDYRTPSHLPPPVSKRQLAFFMASGQMSDMAFVGFGVRFKSLVSITKINPTAIIYKDSTPIFYAVNHATPADFHHKDFWVNMS